jgi:hypothetical protein
MAQVVEYLPNNGKALSSKSNTKGKKNYPLPTRNAPYW